MKEESQSILSTLYENFFMRDFVYALSGSTVIFTIFYGFKEKEGIVNLINYITDNIIRFIAFFCLSYLVGIILSFCDQLWNAIRRKDTKKVGFVDANYMINMAKVKSIWGADVIRRFERQVFFRSVVRNIGTSCFINLLLFIYFFIRKQSIFNITASAIFLIITVSFLLILKRKEIFIIDILRTFEEKIKEKEAT